MIINYYMYLLSENLRKLKNCYPSSDGVSTFSFLLDVNDLGTRCSLLSQISFFSIFPDRTSITSRGKQSENLPGKGGCQRTEYHGNAGQAFPSSTRCGAACRVTPYPARARSLLRRLHRGHCGFPRIHWSLKTNIQ